MCLRFSADDRFVNSAILGLQFNKALKTPFQKHIQLRFKKLEVWFFSYQLSKSSKLYLLMQAFRHSILNKSQFLYSRLFLFPGRKREQAFLFFRRLQTVSKQGHSLTGSLTIEDNCNLRFIGNLWCLYQLSRGDAFFSSRLLAVVNISLF